MKNRVPDVLTDRTPEDRRPGGGDPTLTPKAYSVEQLTRVLSLGRSSIFGLIKRGQLKAVRIGRRTLVPAASVDELLATQES